MIENSSKYLVLARKYRPTKFSDLVGQDILVQILSNGIAENRLPHAFILTGIRGTGKTTTARIIARALNCIGIDGKSDITPSPCDKCEHCQAIADDRHIDVIEMDAASRTGIDDIREVIEASRYKAVSARYKIYIIDEVHMLSKNAFNALLKTLEEPPPHVKFIFATTEIRKIPDTILSRCMRFDLKRIDEETLKNHFKNITMLEGKSIEDEALDLIARAADGSVRDGLSILDQAIMLSQSLITNEQVRIMLGLTNQNYLVVLFKNILQGEPKAILNQFRKINQQGVDPLNILKDLLSFIHWISVRAIDRKLQNYPGLSKEQIEECDQLTQEFSFPLYTRLWQSLIKGIEEASLAPLPEQAVEIILLRLCYLSHLPTPKEIIQNIQKSPQPLEIEPQFQPEEKLIEEKISSPVVPQSLQEPLPKDFKEVVALFHKHKEPLLESVLKNDVHVIHFEPGKITLYLSSHAPKDLIHQLKIHLKKWTKIDWEIIVQDKGDKNYPSLQNQHEVERSKIREALLNEPIVKEVQKNFPDSEVVYIDDIPKEKII